MAFDNTAQFLEKFSFTTPDNFYDVVTLKDRKVGFSVKRKYPDNISYKPTRTAEGEPNNVAVLWVTYLHPSEISKNIDAARVPISVRISNVDLYISNHWDYNFEDPNSPTEESVDESKRTKKPIELESRDEFFYNHTSDTFIDKKGNPVSGLEILEKIYREHCDTVHILKGLSLRLKLLTQSTFHTLLGFIVSFIKAILLKVFGRTIEDEDDLSELIRGYKASSLKKLSTDSLEIFGYKAPKGIIVLYCLLVVLYSFFTLTETDSYLQNIADKELLILAHSIFFLWFLDFVVPPILFGLMNGVIWIRAKIMRMKFKT